MLAMPASRRMAISAATIAAVCLRPVRRISRFDEGLDAEADAIDAGVGPGAGEFRE